MKSLFHKLMNLGVGALFALPLTTFALSSEPIEGVVREEGTNKPIPDAIVVARWSGHLATFAHGKTVCYHVLSTTTDENGAYRFPAWKKKITEDWLKNVRPETVIVAAHKPGYELANRYPVNNPLLTPFTRGREERLKYLERIEQSIRVCRSPEAEEKNLLPFYRALYEEAKKLAKTNEEEKIAEGFLAGIEIIELGYKEGMRRAIERAEKRDRQP